MLNSLSKLDFQSVEISKNQTKKQKASPSARNYAAALGFDFALLLNNALSFSF